MGAGIVEVRPKHHNHLFAGTERMGHVAYLPSAVAREGDHSSKYSGVGSTNPILLM